MAYLKVFIMSALPVAELRVGIPLAIYLGLSVWEALFVSVLGNIIIIMPWLLVLVRLEAFFNTNRVTRGYFQMLVRRVEKKKGSFQKYGKYALFFFVAIPLPTTGAWTACIASRVFRVPERDAFIVITLGVIAAGCIVLIKTILLTEAFF